MCDGYVACMSREGFTVRLMKLEGQVPSPALAYSKALGGA
jgi:hypothetical protein